LTTERNAIATPQRIEAGSDVDVMGDEQSLTRCQAKDKALVAAAVVIVGEHSLDNTFTAHLNTALLSLIGVRDHLIGSRGGTRRQLNETEQCGTKIERCQAQKDKPRRHSKKNCPATPPVAWLSLCAVLIPHLPRAQPPLLVMADHVDDKVIETGAPIALPKLTDVHKYARASG
jgi:hypothetical protein